jgi:putative transposase
MGAKSAEPVALSTPGMLEAAEALELVQIDHTLADVMIVDSEHRRSIGRPWLSLAIDIATRAVLGFHVGLEAPSALAVALCIEHAALPKARLSSPPAWPRPNSRVTSRHFDYRRANREFMSRSNRPYGLTCSQISGVSAA